MELKIYKFKKISLKNIIIGLAFFFNSRFINVFYFDDIAFLSSLYTLFSRVIAIGLVFVLVLKISKTKRINKSQSYLWFAFSCYYILLLLSTFFGGGSLRRLISLSYPIISLMILSALSCKDEKSLKAYIHTLSNVMTFLVGINFIFLLVNPNYFSETRYFLGLENQIGYSLCVGFLLVFLDYKLNDCKIKYMTYFVMFFVTELLVFSGSNVLGALIILLVLYFRPIKEFVLRNKFSTLFSATIALLCSIVFGFLPKILNFPLVKFLVQDVLGKNLTLTSRTYIWDVAVEKIFEKPIIGYGVQDTYNLFHVTVFFVDRASIDTVYSAHNQYLQTLYEGGFLTLFVIFLLVFNMSKMLETYVNRDVLIVFKAVALAILFMFLGEAAGWDSFFFVVALVAVFGKVQNEKVGNPYGRLNFSNNTSL